VEEKEMSDALVVDDEAGFRRMIRRWIEREGAEVTEAESAEQALLFASQDPPKVAFCDVNLPRGQNGFWLAGELRRLYPATVVIMTTGANQFDAAVAGLRAGVSDYLVKPFPPERLRQALAAAVREHRARLSSEVPWRPAESVREARTTSARFAALDAVVASESPAKADHARRVARVAAGIASALGVPEPHRSTIEKAALLREVDRLDVHGITSKVPFLAGAEQIAIAVGEKFDGTGFPRGLKGEAIPAGARILAVAQAYEEIVTGDGKGQLPPAFAVNVLCTSRAHEFDPVVLGALRAAQRIPEA
jgi:response regulator RpfG family c-di-GMP phosphodiesterase